jgi:hypothetical protein
MNGQREMAPRSSARIAVGILGSCIALSGCYLSWPDRDRQMDGGQPDATVADLMGIEAAADGTVTDAPVADAPPECVEPGDCATRTTPQCAGLWRCEQGRCLFACDNCIDEDSDAHGEGEGCVGPDCDDTRDDRFPGAPEVCDGVDNDCDGQTDEGLGQLICGTGVCRVTIPACRDGTLLTCQPSAATAEICTGLDDNCDAWIDEFCPCNDNDTQACWSGTAEQRDVGECRSGTQTCKDNDWGVCHGEVRPLAEACDGLDNDCDRPGLRERGNALRRAGQRLRRIPRRGLQLWPRGQGAPLRSRCRHLPSR